jgi:uncharacterized membrane protein YbhN (UPF0104 family)
VRRVVHGVLFVALAAGVFGLLPRLGGLTRDAAGLRHARPAFVVAVVVAQAASLGCYAQLYRRVLAALGRSSGSGWQRTSSWPAFRQPPHPVRVGGGTQVNVSTLEASGIEATTTGEAIALTSLMSTVALIVLFRTGFAATAGRHVSQRYLIIADVALFLVVTVLAVVLGVGRAPRHRRACGRWAASAARRIRPGIDPEQAAQTSSRLASLARSALSGRAFLASFGFASADLLFDLLWLDLMFLALRYQPGFGPLAVAYAAANIASAIPVTPGGAGGDRGHDGGHHRRLRRAAGHRGPSRTRLPDREVLAPAASRCRGLSSAPAAVSHGRLTRAPDAGRVTRSPRLYVH